MLLHFIVINQHMGVHQSVGFSYQALKTTKINLNGISLQSVASNKGKCWYASDSMPIVKL